ncbi:hypothetical protein TeGR_g4725 [Tetraparma gracilis]|uniref:Uncharacterized protein n=1 Tax=Tetraparma gracilis TaxID=2962635 RepID=A0ABQ6MR14_9STRA|nr:hypothetical protein TeGR_g4725 [Tetraparma gracilis]
MSTIDLTRDSSGSSAAGSPAPAPAPKRRRPSPPSHVYLVLHQLEAAAQTVVSAHLSPKGAVESAAEVCDEKDIDKGDAGDDVSYWIGEGAFQEHDGDAMSFHQRVHIEKRALGP